MQIANYTPSTPAFVGARPLPRASGPRHGPVIDDAADTAYTPLGGALSCDELSRLMREKVDQPISSLARWIVQRDIVNFEHIGQTLFPMFQFDLSTWNVKSGVREVIELLDAAFDKDEIAQWFAKPNEWLEGRAPASLVDTDLRAVREAARADRFVALG